MSPLTSFHHHDHYRHLCVFTAALLPCRVAPRHPPHIPSDLAMLCVANELGPVGGIRGGAVEDRPGQHTISLSAAVSGGGGGDDEADTRVDKDEEGGLKRRQLTGTSPTSCSDP